MEKYTIKVIPNANEDKVIEEIKDLFGNLHIKVKSTKPPEDGKANEAVIKIIAKHFKIAKRDVRIIKGFTSRIKLIEVNLDLIKSTSLNNI